MENAVTRFAPTVKNKKVLHIGHIFNLVANIRFANQRGGTWFHLIDYSAWGDNFDGSLPLTEMLGIPRILAKFFPAPMAHTFWRGDRWQGVIRHTQIVAEIDEEMGTTDIIRGEDLRESIYCSEPGEGVNLWYSPVLMAPGAIFKIGCGPEGEGTGIIPSEPLDHHYWLLAALRYARGEDPPVTLSPSPAILFDKERFAAMHGLVKKSFDTRKHVMHEIQELTRRL